MLGMIRDGLAVSRLTRLITEDFITEPLRKRAFDLDPDSRHIGYLVDCPACASIWVAGLALLLPIWMRRVLAFSEITVLLRREKW